MKKEKFAPFVFMIIWTFVSVLMCVASIHDEEGFSFMVLIFPAIGIIGIILVLTSNPKVEKKTESTEYQDDHDYSMNDNENKKVDKVEFTSDASKVVSFSAGIFLLIFGIIWTFISVCCLLVCIEAAEDLVFTIPFISIFVIVGIAILIGAIKTIKTAKNGQVINHSSHSSSNTADYAIHEKDEKIEQEYGHPADDFFVKYCPYCGESLKRGQERCPSCNAYVKDITK